MPGFVRDGSIWREVDQFHVRDGSIWREVQSAYVRDGTIWRQFFDSTSDFTWHDPAQKFVSYLVEDEGRQIRADPVPNFNRFVSGIVTGDQDSAQSAAPSSGAVHMEFEVMENPGATLRMGIIQSSNAFEIDRTMSDSQYDGQGANISAFTGDIIAIRAQFFGTIVLCSWGVNAQPNTGMTDYGDGSGDIQRNSNQFIFPLIDLRPGGRPINIRSVSPGDFQYMAINTQPWGQL